MTSAEPLSAVEMLGLGMEGLAGATGSGCWAGCAAAGSLGGGMAGVVAGAGSRASQRAKRGVIGVLCEFGKW